MAFQASNPKPKAPELDERPIAAESVVPKAPPLPTPADSATKATVDAIQSVNLDDPEFANIYGWNLSDLELTDVALNRTAEVPRCIKAYCEARDLVWRWLSYPNVKARGMRNYVALSVTPELRKRIKMGDCPATVDIDVSNKLTWREDAFLGVMPRRLHEKIQDSKKQRVVEQTKLARGGHGGLMREAAARAGAKISDYRVEETAEKGL
jgi:hypothetical protein